MSSINRKKTGSDLNANTDSTGRSIKNRASKNHKGRLFIGTSGWQYKHWRSAFFPDTVRVKDQFAYYRSRFRTVELNASFYHMPAKRTFENSGHLVESDFIFAVKANRYFTHLKKLNVDQVEVDQFFAAVTALDVHLGPILFQLPPRWHFDLPRLARFLELLPKDLHYAFEFRDQSWYQPALYDLLRKYRVAFCIYDLGGHQSPSIVSPPFVYMRLHGPGAKYQGSYSPSYLKALATKVEAWIDESIDVYIYFANDQSGLAPKNAAYLQELLS